MNYFEKKKNSNLKENEEYKKVLKEMEKIKKKFPKVRSFIKDDEIVEFTQEEMQAILNIIGLYKDRAIYEENKLKEKIAIITGGAKGIGKAIALELLKERCKVIILDIDKVEGRKLQDDLNDMIKFINIDILKENKWKMFVII